MKKTIIITALLVCGLVASAFASDKDVLSRSFTAYSGIQNTASPVGRPQGNSIINTTGYINRWAQVLGKNGAQAFGNMSGALAVQESYDGATWNTVGYQLRTTGAFGTSLTADNVIYWQSVAPYTRFMWTRRVTADGTHKLVVRFLAGGNR